MSRRPRPEALTELLEKLWAERHLLDFPSVQAMIDDVVALVQAGDATAVGDSLGRIDAALDRVLDGAARVGATGARVGRVATRNASELLAIGTELSDLQDADMVDATTELRLQETGYHGCTGRRGEGPAAVACRLPQLTSEPRWPKPQRLRMPRTTRSCDSRMASRASPHPAASPSSTWPPGRRSSSCLASTTTTCPWS
jgi:hypothetical protein